MKFAQENIDKAGLRISRAGTWLNPKGGPSYYYMESCTVCGSPYLGQKRYGKIDETCSYPCSNKLRSGVKRPKEVVDKIQRKRRRQLLLTIADIVPVRKSENDETILETRCVYCGKWFRPTAQEINGVIKVINGERQGGAHFYCSDSCKQECPVFKRILYPKGFRRGSSREVQPDLRKMVLERDGWICQKCGSTANLHCHHIDGLNQEPLLSADMDECITVCKPCHKAIHAEDGCKGKDFRC